MLTSCFTERYEFTNSFFYSSPHSSGDVVDMHLLIPGNETAAVQEVETKTAASDTSPTSSTLPFKTYVHHLPTKECCQTESNSKKHRFVTVIEVSQQDECNVCRNNFFDSRSISKTNCKHLIHDHCINTWTSTTGQNRKDKCPQCIQKIENIYCFKKLEENQIVYDQQGIELHIPLTSTEGKKRFILIAHENRLRPDIAKSNPYKILAVAANCLDWIIYASMRTVATVVKIFAQTWAGITAAITLVPAAIVGGISYLSMHFFTLPFVGPEEFMSNVSSNNDNRIMAYALVIASMAALITGALVIDALAPWGVTAQRVIAFSVFGGCIVSVVIHCECTKKLSTKFIKIIKPQMTPREIYRSV